jgi:hypothetical protein
MLRGLHLTFTRRAGHERSSRPVLHLSNKDIQQSPWKSATNQKTNRSWLAGTILDGTTPMLRRSRKEKMKTFGPRLNRSMLSKRLNTIVTAIATPVRPCNNNFFPCGDIADWRRYACSNARYCQGHTRYREESTQASQAEHVR